LETDSKRSTPDMRSQQAFPLDSTRRSPTGPRENETRQASTRIRASVIRAGSEVNRQASSPTRPNEARTGSEVKQHPSSESPTRSGPPEPRKSAREKPLLRTKAEELGGGFALNSTMTERGPTYLIPRRQISKLTQMTKNWSRNQNQQKRRKCRPDATEPESSERMLPTRD
jgi:hypothetical protein